jgi:glycosyltransferase involved in cell wall biosynthesis
VVQTVHNYRHVCAAYTLFRDGHICRDCVGRRFPAPAVVHRCYRGSRAQSAVLASTLALHRRTFHRVDRFIALAAGVADFLREYGIPDERIVIKPNSLPDPGPHDLPGEGFLFVGRLSPEKGLALLLAAWREHPVGALGKLRIAGDGPQRGLAEQAAAERDDIEFVGRATPAEVRELMRRSAVLVVPSLWHDVLPTVIIEALANARPVLATALGGMPWMIDKAGWTVPANSAALAAALPAAAAEAPGRYAVARERYLSTFTPELVLDQLLAVYRDLAAARSG